uniref:Epoxide hydrolase n=2 Tax=Culex pipiens TaxID=7175 RepID=A0A8D8H5G4_CULPI
MGFVTRFAIAGTALLLGLFLKQCRELTREMPVPTVDTREFWGPGSRDKYDESIKVKPFELAYDKEVIEELKARLDKVPNLPEPLEGSNFEYGFNSKRLREILKYWRSDYLERWDERQKFLNQFPQFKTQIQGLDIHFIHVKPAVRNPKRILPLILLHGWPGSVREFYEMIPKLTTRSGEKEYVFEVIVPSLPGYGFSQAAAKQGLSPAKIAVIMRNLMARLGFSKYYVHGGDWGSIVANLMATFFQNEVLGVHSTMCMNNAPIGQLKNVIGSLAPTFVVDPEHVDYYFPFLDRMKLLLEETGYMHIQATKPDTIGAALTGNPVGLAAYILEKFSTWTNPTYRSLPDGGLEKYFSLDALLDNIMIYYLTDTITTSQRLYSEAFNIRELTKDYDRTPTKVPAACCKFRYELFQQTDWALKDHLQNLIQSNHYPDGGHFGALQLPDVLYADIVQFVNRLYRREDQ